MARAAARVRIATAGWTIPRACAAGFPEDGAGLARYATRFDAVEINSTFYRRHRASTFARWRELVPEGFRFSLKLSRSLTHEAQLAAPHALLDDFFADAVPLGDKLGAVLVQLAGRHAYEPALAAAFFAALRERWTGAIAFEPRHASWYEAEPTALLAQLRIGRVVADPPRPVAAAESAPGSELLYLRLHGSPRTYYSAYGEDRIAELLAARIRGSKAREIWCVFDNTASGAALADAVLLQDLLLRARV